MKLQNDELKALYPYDGLRYTVVKIDEVLKTLNKDDEAVCKLQTLRDSLYNTFFPKMAKENLKLEWIEE